MATNARLRAAGYKVRTRAQWGTKHAGLYAERLRSRPFDLPAVYGFVHITVTNQHGDAGMRLIEEIGFERFGTGCSYNWCIDHATDHTIYEGQPLAAKGAHTVNDKNVPGFPNNLNLFGHAVAYMGDVTDPVCDQCVDTIAAIFAAEQLEQVQRTNAPIYPHRKFAPKSCPGDKLAARMDDINAAVDLKVKHGDLRTGSAAPTKDWFDMATAAELEALVRKVVKEEVLGAKVQHKDDETGKVTDVSTETLLEYVDLRTQRLETAVKKLVAAVDALGKATSQPSA